MTLTIHQNSRTEAPAPSNPRASCATLSMENEWCTPAPLSLAPQPALQIPGVSAGDPEEAGGVTMVENGASAQPEDFVSTESVFAADITDAQAFKPCIPTAAWRRPDRSPREEGLATVETASTQTLEEAPQIKCHLLQSGRQGAN